MPNANSHQSSGCRVLSGRLQSQAHIGAVNQNCRPPMRTTAAAMISMLCGKIAIPPKSTTPLPKNVGIVNAYGPQMSVASDCIVTAMPIVAVTVVRKCLPSSGVNTIELKKITHDGAEEHGHDQREPKWQSEPADQRDADEPAIGDPFAIGKVHDAGGSDCQREPQRHEGVDAAHRDATQRDLKKGVHR